ncbi:type III secretion system cytoplasmic ring protein SctQ [Vibrio sagamiensis]|uniref:Type III secretion system protein n=1 Tax=Vibrio sagamiensis NBRC 104589 TaxID=1219064 RepID=A0A511QE40_9VIBR|nr:type III secretion system cytoplasmic ring protein SctQ [Vibrio sagamiensis]PNQ58513.1 YscQ/HrcQ family type III secretion apparatus protein [Vibrio agarivorans]GEM75457.1 type III secretion system protein [Vibrio sagamiensis NBRC 104589]
MTLPLPKIDAPTLALSNQLSERKCYFYDDDGVNLSINLDSKPAFIGYRLTVLIGGQAIDIEFSTAQLQQWLKEVLNATAFDSLPEPLQFALLNQQIEEYNNIIKNVFGQLPVLSKLIRCELPATSKKVLTLTLNRAEGTLCLWVYSGQEYLISALPKATSYLTNSITLPFSLSLGETKLKIEQFQSLEKGDVIFFDQCYLSQHQAILKVSNQNLWRCELDGNTITILQKDSSMNDTNNLEVLTDHQQLPVEISFDIGSQTVTLEQLNSLQPGFTFELNQPVNKPVTVRANGKAIGQGELVNVNEHLGVRLLDLFGEEQEPA